MAEARGSSRADRGRRGRRRAPGDRFAPLRSSGRHEPPRRRSRPGPRSSRLERLCRYVARPPLALGRLEAMADGRLAYRLKTPWRDRTTHVVMERRELLERLAPLIPPPRVRQVRYHGVLAPCASGPDRAVPTGKGAKGAARPDASSPGTDGGSIGVADAAGRGQAIEFGLRMPPSAVRRLGLRRWIMNGGVVAGGIVRRRSGDPVGFEGSAGTSWTGELEFAAQRPRTASQTGSVGVHEPIGGAEDHAHLSCAPRE